MAKLVAKNYSSALFELALEENKLDKIYEEVKLVQSFFQNDSSLLKILQHPHVTMDEKLSVVSKTFGNYVSDEIIGLFDIIVRKNREDIILSIFNFFIEQADEHKGIVYAKITSAIPLNDAQIIKIKENLAKNSNYQVSILSMVDPSLIGGLRIEVNGKVIDGSIKKYLTDMKQSLNDVRLA